MAEVTPTDRPMSVCNRYVIDNLVTSLCCRFAVLNFLLEKETNIFLFFKIFLILKWKLFRSTKTHVNMLYCTSYIKTCIGINISKW